MAEPMPRISRHPPPVDLAPERIAGIPADLTAIRQLPARARLTLRLDPVLIPTGGAAGGFTLDMPINRYKMSAQRMAMRLGPDEWLLSGPEHEESHIAGEVGAALAGRHYSLVDVGHSRTAFAVSGVSAAAIINSGCPLDLARAAFPAGSATRTLIGKCEVVLARIDDQPTFEVECARSFATYLADFLLEGARELRAER